MIDLHQVLRTVDVLVLEDNDFTVDRIGPEPCEVLVIQSQRKRIDRTGDLVVSSKPFCFNDTYYVAFRHEERYKLNAVCGPTLEYCTILAGEIK